MTSRRFDPPIRTPHIPNIHRCGGRVVREGPESIRFRCAGCEQAFRQITVLV